MKYTAIISALLISLFLLPGEISQLCAQEEDKVNPDATYYFTPTVKWVKDKKGYPVNVTVTVKTNLPKGTRFSFAVFGGDLVIGVISNYDYQINQVDRIEKFRIRLGAQGGLAAFSAIPEIIPMTTTTFTMKQEKDINPYYIVPETYKVEVKYDDIQDNLIELLIANDIRQRAVVLELPHGLPDTFESFQQRVKQRFQTDLRIYDILLRDLKKQYQAFEKETLNNYELLRVIKEAEAKVKDMIQASEEVKISRVCHITRDYRNLILGIGQRVMIDPILADMRQAIEDRRLGITRKVPDEMSLQGKMQTIQNNLIKIYDRYGLQAPGIEKVFKNLDELIRFLYALPEKLKTLTAGHESAFQSWKKENDNKFIEQLFELAENAPIWGRADAMSIAQATMTVIQSLQFKGDNTDMLAQAKQLIQKIKEYEKILKEKK